MAAGGQVAFRAPPLWLWALCSCCFFPWCRGVVSCFYLVALRAVGCRVCCFVCFRRPRARWVFLVVAGCLGPCPCAPVLVLLIRARGPAVTIDRGAKQRITGAGTATATEATREPKQRPALRLGVCLLGFPAVVCAVAPVPPIASLCNRIVPYCWFVVVLALAAWFVPFAVCSILYWWTSCPC